VKEATKVDSYPTVKRRVFHIKHGRLGNLDRHEKDRWNREKMDAAAEELVVIWTTVVKLVDAEQLADGLVRARLAACVQVDSGMLSHYQWQGEIESTTEYRVVIKTRRSLLAKLKVWIKEHHPYEVPQFVAMEVLDTNESYRTWVLESTKPLEEG